MPIGRIISAEHFVVSVSLVPLAAVRRTSVTVGTFVGHTSFFFPEKVGPDESGPVGLNIFQGFHGGGMSLGRGQLDERLRH